MGMKDVLKKLTARHDAEAPPLGSQVKKAIEIIKQARNGEKAHEPSATR